MEALSKSARTSFWIEGTLLVLVTPWLLFPNLYLTITLLSLLILLLTWIIILRKKKALIVTPFNLIVLLYVSSISVAFLTSTDRATSVWRGTTSILAFALWRYVGLSTQNWSEFRIVKAGFFIVALTMLFMGAPFVDWPITLPVLGALTQVLRPILDPLLNPSFSINPNQFGGVLAFLLPIFIAVLRQWEPSQQHYQWAHAICLTMFIGLLVILLVSTQSYSSWLGTVVGLCSLLLFQGFLRRGVLGDIRNSWLTLITMLGLIGALLVTVHGGTVAQDGRAELGQKDGMSLALALSPRLEIWSAAINTIEDFPLTGSGPGTFRNISRRYLPLTFSLGLDVGHAHNIYLQVALDYGLPALVSYLALLIMTMIVGVQVANRLSSEQALIIGIQGGVIALHTYGLFDAVAPGSKPEILQWMALGLLTAMVRLAD